MVPLGCVPSAEALALHVGWRTLPEDLHRDTILVSAGSIVTATSTHV